MITEVKDKEIMDITEACGYLSISKPTMYRMIKAGKITCSKVGAGKGMYRFRKIDLDKYLDANAINKEE